MYEVKMSRGYYEVEINNEPVLPWLTLNEDKNVYYFLPNNYTRKKFYLDMWSKKNVIISEEDKEYLRTIDLSGYLGEYTKTVIEPYLGDDKELKEYQRDSIYKMLTHKNYCMFLGPGTGKTLIAITYLMNARPDKVLILTPKKVVGQYLDEVCKYLNYKPSVLQVTNYEQILAKPQDYTHHYNCVIIDESHRLKEFTNQVGTYIRNNMEVDRMFLFSGTPQDRSRAEILPQFALFDKRFMPTKSKTLQHYFYLDEYFNPKTEKQPEELSELIKLVSTGALTENLITLTQEFDHKITYSVSEEYKFLFKQEYLQVDGKNIICDTPATKMMKLRQLSNGYIIDEEKKVHRIYSQKQEVFKDTLKDLPHGIIYTSFDEDQEIVCEILNELGYKYTTVNGKMTKKKSDEAIDAFKNKKVQWIVMQAESGKEGLDLTMTNNILFYSLPLSYITFSQCRHRIRRLGQTKPCHYYYFISKDGPVESRILKQLNKKKSTTGALFTMFVRGNIK